ncbi:MAG: FtsQ-type POTRA domain-containing protein [Gammaproteobacteria bacterium]|nr:FtsQ-type POTRA domain-containing protein [Gammaproteobacteria bacterium]
MQNAEANRHGAEQGMGLFKAAVLLFTLLFVLLVLAFGADWLLRTDNFPVQHVRFEGEFQHVTEQELEQAVMHTVHGNFFMLNLDAIKARVEALPWIYKASVRRQWPQDVSVQFVEQQLAARWGDSAWLNQLGDVVRVSGKDLPLELPRLAGPDGTGASVLQHYQNFGRILTAAGLKLERLVLTPRRTWQLGLANGMTLVLEQEQPEPKLERFARTYAQSFAQLGGDIKQVDLRYANGFAVEWISGRAASPRQAVGHAGPRAANEG